MYNESGTEHAVDAFGLAFGRIMDIVGWAAGRDSPSIHRHIMSAGRHFVEQLACDVSEFRAENLERVPIHSGGDGRVQAQATAGAGSTVSTGTLDAWRHWRRRWWWRSQQPPQYAPFPRATFSLVAIFQRDCLAAALPFFARPAPITSTHSSQTLACGDLNALFVILLLYIWSKGNPSTWLPYSWLAYWRVFAYLHT